MTARPVEQTIAQLKALLGPRGWLDDACDVESYLTEQRGLWRGQALLVALPDTTDHVAAIMRLCAQARIKVIPQGGNTGLCGASVPPDHGDNVILSLKRMNRIRSIDAANFSIVAEAGCILADVQAAAEAENRLFPLSLGAEGSCQIGGNIATNAGGLQVLRYGTTRELTLGLEVVLADGTIWNGLRSLRKDNTGYDLKHLFIGSEGTLGAITAASLRLFPQPLARTTALVGLDDVAAAMQLFAAARAETSDLLSAFELMSRFSIQIATTHIAGVTDPLRDPHPWYALIEVASSANDGATDASLARLLERSLERGLIRDAVVSSSVAQANALWRIREAVVEAQPFEGASIKHDVSVPISGVADFITRAITAVEAAMPGARVLAFGHCGDGNVHFNLCQHMFPDRDGFMHGHAHVNRLVHDLVAEAGGSISAEHGIGLLKKDELRHYKSAIDLDLMRRIRLAFDPGLMLNPGKMIDA